MTDHHPTQESRDAVATLMQQAIAKLGEPSKWEKRLQRRAVGPDVSRDAWERRYGKPPAPQQRAIPETSSHYHPEQKED